jgi:nitrate reductase delta subunit
MTAPLSSAPQARRVVFQAASVLLDYPGTELWERRGLVEEAVGGLPRGEARDRLGRFLGHLGATGATELAAHYVETFDLRRRNCLYLTYYTDGDTRRRGPALAELKARYRAAGWAPPDGGELHDYLPVVLEFAARCAPEDGAAILREHRAGLETLHMALTGRGTPYADVVAAVRAELGAAPAEAVRAALRTARGGPPRESVGLETYQIGATRP